VPAERDAGTKGGETIFETPEATGLIRQLQHYGMVAIR
jgi:hypothetical protein